MTERPPHRQYKTPRHLLPELEKFITEMLAKGWIEKSTSEYSSPVLIIPKPPPSTKYRFVVDLRAVNDRTKKRSTYLPTWQISLETYRQSSIKQPAAYAASLSPSLASEMDLASNMEIEREVGGC